MRATILAILLSAAFSAQALARGDKVIPQVPDGPNIRTKFDLFNISPSQAINNFKIRFYRQDGSAWNLRVVFAGSEQQGSEFTLILAPRQTVRLQTAGLSSPTVSGYAVVTDEEPQNSTYSLDFVLGISVLYEVYSGGRVVDTVSVPVAAPTAIGSFPVEVDQAQDLYTGLAVVNLSTTGNTLTVRLYSADGSGAGSANMILLGKEQRAEFLYQRLFPNVLKFKGMAEFKANGPVAMLSLLQTSTASGVQYATLMPVDKEALRRDTYTFLPQPLVRLIDTGDAFMPLDIDSPVVDYFRMDAGEEGYAMDLTYETESRTARSLRPLNGAAVSTLGKLDSNAFDAVSLPTLKGLQYTAAKIDLSDGSAGLSEQFAFAVRTDLGNYAKVRIFRIVEVIDQSDGVRYRDLGLEIYVYR